jgi:hypothetical protein
MQLFRDIEIGSIKRFRLLCSTNHNNVRSGSSINQQNRNNNSPTGSITSSISRIDAVMSEVG